MAPVTGCLGCLHHRFSKGVHCGHPARPPEKTEVVRWFYGCPQHEPLKDPVKDPKK